MKNHHKLLCTAAAVAITVALSGPIMAADAPMRKMGPAPAAEIFNWSGFYLGGHVGYGRSKFFGTRLSGQSDGQPKPKGFLIGFHAGQNIQTAANWLWGWEVDVTATPGWNHTIANVGGTASNVVNGQTNAMASLRARLGWIFDRTLLYATGGIAAVAWNGSGHSTPIKNRARTGLPGLLWPELAPNGRLDPTSASGWKGFTTGIEERKPVKPALGL